MFGVTFKRMVIAALTTMAAFLVLLPSITIAQTSSQVQAELEKTDRLIERAADAVRAAGSVEGRERIERAYELQKLAWQAYRFGFSRKALALTKSAREQAEKALALAQTTSTSNGAIERELDRTDEILAKARDIIGSCQDQKAISLYERAASTQTEARGYYRGNRLRIALRASLNARETCKRSIEICSRPDAHSDEVEAELRRTDELILRAAETSSELPVVGPVAKLLEDARAIQSSAWESFKLGNLKTALAQTLKAREVALKALKALETESKPERVLRLIESTDKLISKVREGLSDSPDAEVDKLADAAVEHQKRASDLLEKGDIEAAMVDAKAAQELARKALDMIER